MESRNEEQKTQRVMSNNENMIQTIRPLDTILTGRNISQVMPLDGAIRSIESNTIFYDEQE